MTGILLLTLSSFTITTSRLVVHQDSVASLELETIKQEGELVNSTVTPYLPCPLIEEQRDQYRIYIRDTEGREVEQIVEVAIKLDYTYDVDKIHSAREPWITSYILIRYSSCEL